MYKAERENRLNMARALEAEEDSGDNDMMRDREESIARETRE